MKRKSGFLEGLGSKKRIIGDKMKKSFKPKAKKMVSDEVSKKELWQSRRKKGRLIVRNLPFKITEEKFREHFEKFGELNDVSLLKKPDGKLVGCGFVEFVSREDASNAIEKTSGKPLLNRPIIVDWAIPKDIFNNTQRQQVKEEIKEEILSSDDEDEKIDFQSKGKKEVKMEVSNSDGESESGKEDDSGKSEANDSDTDKKFNRPPPPQDVQEGRTVFLKGVPFTATQEELKSCMNKFGPVLYALICTDPVTEHSRGSAFVKFQKKESADACLAADSSELEFGNSILQPHLALEKQQLHNQTASQKAEKRAKDGRNLFLVKEGVVQAGSPAAKDVSAADMSKRLKLEQWKTQMLRNLSMIISRNRIVVHNLPPTLDDEGLRKIIKKHAPPGSRLFEVRVMRDLRRVDAQGRGVSKEFGFVTFKQHEDALSTLRNINNNPSIFTKQKRPIVGFSIENKAILNAKQRRMELSRNKNPYYQREKKEANINIGSTGNKISSQSSIQQEQAEEKETKSFAGFEAHANQTVKLPTRGTLRSQVAIHRQSIQQEKRKVKQQRKQIFEKQMKQQKEAQQKIKIKKSKPSKDDKEDKSFNLLVNKYREGLEHTVDLKKWYD